MSEFRRLLSLIRSYNPQTILLHLDAESDIESALESFQGRLLVSTSDLRFTHGRRDEIESPVDLVVYLPDSHDPQSVIKQTVAQYVDSCPVILVGERKSTKHLVKSLETDKRFYAGDLMVCSLTPGQKVCADVQQHSYELCVDDTCVSLATQQGLFSYKDVDAGTRFLLETVAVPGGARILDFGCGYGAIGLWVASRHPRARVVLTDSDLRAVSFAQKNAQRNQLSNVDVVPAHLMRGVSGRYDVILSNPPTHTSREEVQEFLERFRRLLADGGEVYMVINQIVDYERDAKQFFSDVSVVATRGKYKIVRLSGP